MKTPRKGPAVVEEISRWLSHLEKLGRSPRTVGTYRDALNSLSGFLARKEIAGSSDVRPVHLAAWSRQLGRSGCAASTANLYVRVAQYWFAWLVETDRLFFNPAALLARPKLERTLGRCPSEADMRRLLRSVSGSDVQSLRDRALLELAYSTGGRCEELAHLDTASVDLVRRSVVLHGKGGIERASLLTTEAVIALRAYITTARPQFLRGRGDQTALFVGQRAGRRLATYAIANVVRRRGARVGLVVSPHDIRRAFATHMLNAGANLEYLKDLLGHAGLSHLHHYLKQASTEMLATVRRSPLNQ